MLCQAEYLMLSLFCFTVIGVGFACGNTAFVVVLLIALIVFVLVSFVLFIGSFVGFVL